MRLGMGLGLGNLLSGQPITGMSNKYSFNLDGSNDYLDCGTSLGNTLGDDYSGGLTFSMWFNANSTTTNDGLFQFNVSGLECGVIFDSNKLAWYLNGAEWTKSSTISTGQWYHLTCVLDTSSSSNSKIYINGSADSTGSGTFPSAGDLDFSGKTFIIGKYFSDSFVFDGNIDEVAVWDTALSASDVAKIASKPVDFSKASTYATDRTSNLKLWLRAGDKVLPEEDTSIARSDFYTDFDGSNDYIDTGATFQSTFRDSFSFSMWVKPNDGIPSSLEMFGGGRDSAGGTASKVYLILQTNGKLQIQYESEGQSASPTTSSAVFPNGVCEWTHLAWVADNGADEIYIYVNGAVQALDASNNLNGVTMSNFTSADNFVIGAGNNDTTIDYFLDGAISNLSLYKTALDAQTIKQFAKSRYTPMRDNRFSVVDFDGSNDYIQLPVPLSYTNHSISVWVNHSGTYKTIFASEDSGSDGIRLFTDDGSRLQYEINGSTAVASTAYTDQWVHYFCTYDGSTMRVYINGIQAQTTSASETVSTTTNARIGVNTTELSQYLSGSISSFAFYSTTKSAEEVYAIYQQGITYDESSLSGLVGYWRMGDDTSKAYPTIADSSSNSNDGTITNGASDDIVQQMVAGYDMGAFESTGEELNGSVLVNGDFDTDSDWSKGTGWTISDGKARCDGTQTGNTNLQTSVAPLTSGTLYKVTFDLTRSAGNFRFLIGSSGSSDYYTTDGTHSFYKVEDGNDHVYAQGDSNFVGTLDNVKVQTILQSADLSDTHPAIIDVNEPVVGAELFTGWENEPLQSSTYYKGWSSFTTSGQTVTASQADEGGMYSKVFNTNAFSIVSGTAYEINITIDSRTNTYIRGLTASTNSEGAFVVSNSIWQNTTVGSAKYILFANTTTSSARLHIRQQGGNTASVSISAISIKPYSGNTGLMTNQDSADLVYSSVLPDQSFLGTGVNSAYNFLDFDGTDAKVSLSSQQSLTGNFTVSGWMNRADANVKIFLSDSTSGSTLNYLWIENSGDLAIDFQGLSDFAFPNSNPPHSEWFHFAITRNAKIFKCYVNGSLTDTIDKTSAGAYDQTWTYNQIGTYSTGQYWYDGYMSNLAIHNKELSSTEISAIYTAGRHTNLLDSYSDNLKGYYAFGALDAVTGLPDTDSTIYDRSGNSNHGTTSGTATGDLKSPPNATPNGYSSGDTNRSTTIP